MTPETKTDTSYKEALTSMYFLMICADRRIDSGELEMGRIMRSIESMEEQQFYQRMDLYSNHDNRVIYGKCIHVLQQCSQYEQIRCMAWMKLIAFSDGSMGSREWDLFQNICTNELGLSLNDILAEQKELKKAFA